MTDAEPKESSSDSSNEIPKDGKRKKSVVDHIRRLSTKITRTKSVGGDVMETNLKRCLTSFDVTLLSIGHMVGSGVYVLTPTVAHNEAGPAIVVSFLISGIASFLAALCYAELGVRYPRSGSAYSYTYLALGEFWAFLVGWNVALENVIGVATIARACSSYVDSIVGKAISNGTSHFIGHINSPYISKLDFLSLSIVILFVVLLSFGVGMTSGLNNLFSVVNIASICIIIGVGAYFADINNWTNPDTGGFLPYGMKGVFTGAATCFYAYVGFDSIAAAGEEAKNPKKSIPLATMISMGIAATVYILVGAVLTLMVSYTTIKSDSGIPDALAARGAYWAKTVVVIGALCGMSTGIIGSLFALTRVIYAMADDGLLFPVCAAVHSKTKIPLGSMYIFGTFAAIMSFLLEVKVLAQLMSIGTLFAYLVVSSSVIVLRYRPAHTVHSFEPQEMNPMAKEKRESSSANDPEANVDDSIGIAGENPNSSEEENWDDQAGRLCDRFSAVDRYLEWPPGRLVIVTVFTYAVFAITACGFAAGCMTQIMDGKLWAGLVLALLVLGSIVSLFIIIMHQQSKKELGYKVPWVPIIPALSVAVNAWLIANFMTATFIRLAVWVVVGSIIYFSYGIRHSKLNALGDVVSKTALLSDKPFPVQSWTEVNEMMEESEQQKRMQDMEKNLNKHASGSVSADNVKVSKL